jgi:hypothetical protein
MYTYRSQFSQIETLAIKFCIAPTKILIYRNFLKLKLFFFGLKYSALRFILSYGKNSLFSKRYNTCIAVLKKMKCFLVTRLFYKLKRVFADSNKSCLMYT